MDMHFLPHLLQRRIRQCGARMPGESDDPMVPLAVQEMSIPQLTGIESMLQQQGRSSTEQPSVGSDHIAGSKSGDLSWLFESIDD